VPAESSLPRGRRGARGLAAATLAYSALAIALTWPLAAGMTRDVPSDLGDPILNCWILAWDADHLLRALAGHPGALAGYWHANIYYPHPLALAYSEHLTAQAVQALPVYALTRNAVLCYNLLFLSTFILSAAGMFLLARELTGSGPAAFIAGLAYGFAPYRFGSLPHLPVLSSAWMPLALFGFRRFFDTRRAAALAGASTAWIVQNLSCGYYLVFFGPVVALYVVWEITTRRLWSNIGALGRITAAGGMVAIVTAPFVIPYMELRRLGFPPRSLDEVQHYSADVYAYLTAAPTLHVWGRAMRTWPRAEAWLFPGATIAALAALAIVATWRAWSSSGRPGRAAAVAPSPSAQALLERVVGCLFVVLSVIVLALWLGWTVHLPLIKITSLDRQLTLAAVAAGLLLVVSSRTREALGRCLSSPVGMLVILTGFAATMSFGPEIRSHGRLLTRTTVYALFYDHVPGFDGLRVPARFGMIVALGLAALAGHGAGILVRLRHGAAWVAVAAALIVLESAAIPLPLNGSSPEYRQRDLAPLPGVVATGAAIPPVYRFLARLPQSAAIIELPFGEEDFEVRYMLYSATHWRPLVNGYSGGAPVEYGLLAEALKEALMRPEPAWKALAASGATHALVHEAFYKGSRGRDITAWLSAHGARAIASFGADRVLELPSGDGSPRLTAGRSGSGGRSAGS
jgi:hypothetical protein